MHQTTGRTTGWPLALLDPGKLLLRQWETSQDGTLGDHSWARLPGMAPAEDVTHQSSPSMQETSILPKILKHLQAALTVWQNRALAFHSTSTSKWNLHFPYWTLKYVWWNISAGILLNTSFFNLVKTRMIKLGRIMSQEKFCYLMFHTQTILKRCFLCSALSFIQQFLIWE